LFSCISYCHLILSIFDISFSRIYSFPATTSWMKVCYLMVRVVVDWASPRWR
jgi:hypothetical protein